MKRFFLLTLFLLVTAASQAQCPVGNVILRSQAEVNAFGTNYPDCATITGNLLIGDDFSLGSNISDLSPLAGISEVTGGLSISYNNVLTNLDDLENLTSIGTGLTISENPSLVSLDGLSNMVPVESEFLLNINNNETLSSLAGLEGITSVGVLSISYNPLIINLEGLSGLTAARGLNAYGNLAMTSFQGLEGITMFPDGFSIGDNSALINFTGLDNITTVGGLFVVQNNEALENMVGLGSLVSVSNFMVGGNDALSSLTGLSGALTISGFLLLRENPLLSMCAVKPVCDFVAGEGIAQIELNSTGCNNVEEVGEACLALPVSLIEFAAKPEGRTVQLSWSTTEEVNSDYIEVQASSDLEYWHSLAKISTKGESNQKQEYTFTDASPATGTSFYRLRMVDLDGSYTYSPIRSLVLRGADLIIYPNPVADVVFLDGENMENIKRTDLVDRNGRIVMVSSVLTDEGLSLKNLQPGLYSLRIYRKDGSMQIVKMLKN
jgi:hypothetical protein